MQNVCKITLLQTQTLASKMFLCYMQADHEFFESHAITANFDVGEDKSFFDKVDQDAFELGQELDEKLEGAAETADRITQGQKK